MKKTFHITFLVWLTIALANANSLPEEQTFIGQIIAVEETGLGPFDGISIKNTDTEQVLYFLVEQGRYADISPRDAIPTDHFEVRFRTHQEKTIVRIEPRKTPGQCSAPANACVEGTYLSGQIGDMGSYITIKSISGEDTTYQGNFDIDATNSTLFAGKAVALHYEIDTQYELIDIMPAGAGELSIAGEISTINISSKNPAKFTIENTNEMVEAVIPQTLLTHMGTTCVDQLIGTSVKIDYVSKGRLVLISYAFETPTLNEMGTDESALKKYQHLNSFSDEGRYVASRKEGGKVFLEIETAGGQILEDVLVPASLNLSDSARYQDHEMIFTYVFTYENTAVAITKAE